ncbi:hypothetical protein ACVWW2_004280 [Bradyrhizobium sp. LM4.3]
MAFVDGDRVVAALTEDVDLAGVGDGGGATDWRHRPVIDENAACVIAADHDAVIGAIAENGELARNRGKNRGSRHSK